LYDETAELKSPECDQFVISISPHDHMPMTGTFIAGQTGRNGMFVMIISNGAAGRGRLSSR
jgi:hypothetical protein